jgi:outer membrane lipoprotein SlyB
VGAGVGAIGGGAVGGGKGAAIGAGVGAAAGVVEALFSDRRLQLQKGTMLEVRLDRPLQLPWR